MNKLLTQHSTTLFYRVGGEGNPGLPVLLLHGFAEDGSVWDRQVAHLKKDHRLIIPDLPGSGRSPALAEITEAPSIEALTESVKTILDAEAIDQCVMIGHSMGGYITLAFAEKYPDRLKAFGLFHSTAYEDTGAKKTNRRKSIEFIRRHGSAEFIRQSVPNLFAEHYKQEHPEVVAELIERYSGFPPASLIYYYSAMINRPDRTRILREFRGPVLFIIGDQDNAIPLTDSLEQCHMPACAHILIPEDCGHQGMLEKTGQCNRMLSEFLRSIPH
ncbi:MAG: alpha/beta hydrolase [Puia sp.]|nr:alpha/beta hydrolase [Puia sp.]